jgi:ditrans,polycis-polyprenyl diphosphate synthase
MCSTWLCPHISPSSWCARPLPLFHPPRSFCCGSLPAAASKDGNRRFARRANQPVQVGHVAGFDALLHLLEFSLDLGVRQVTVYAFSQDNFSRPAAEVDGLMLLALQKFEEFLSHESLVMKRGVRVRILATSPELLSEPVRKACRRVEAGTAGNAGPGLNVCFSYSGAEEIASAVKCVSAGIRRGELAESDVCDSLLHALMDLHAAPPPCLVVRTSGESRLSDFLLWHLSQSSVYFVDVLWPDLSVFLLCLILLACAAPPRRSHTAPFSLTPAAQRFVQAFHAQRPNMWGVD